MQSRSLVLMNPKQSKVLRGYLPLDGLLQVGNHSHAIRRHQMPSEGQSRYLPLDGLLQVAARAIALRSQSQVLLWNRRELDVGEARDGCVVRVGEQSVVSEMVACN
jgi:hypothetical protein